MDDTGIVYLKSYVKNGNTYPVGSSGSFPIMTSQAPCYTISGLITREQKMSILNEEMEVAQKKEFQNLLILGSTNTFIGTIALSGGVSEPILYI
jgi:hypothetical protein